MDNNSTLSEGSGVFSAMIASGPVIIQMRDGVMKTLLVKHGDKPAEQLKWKFCGGKIFAGSDFEATAIREAEEEIGVTARLIKPLKPMIIWNERPETGSADVQAVVLIHYLAEIDAEPIQGEQTVAMEWFDINDLPPDCSTNIRPVIEDYLKQK